MQLENNWLIFLTQTQNLMNNCLPPFLFLNRFYIVLFNLGRHVVGEGGSFKWFISQTHTTPDFYLMCFKAEKKTHKKQKANTSFDMKLKEWQARGAILNKAWPWLHTTLSVPCIINVNSECCTVNIWVDFLEKAAPASFFSTCTYL